MANKYFIKAFEDFHDDIQSILVSSNSIHAKSISIDCDNMTATIYITFEAFKALFDISKCEVEEAGLFKYYKTKEDNIVYSACEYCIEGGEKQHA